MRVVIGTVLLLVGVLMHRPEGFGRWSVRRQRTYREDELPNGADIEQTVMQECVEVRHPTSNEGTVEVDGVAGEDGFTGLEAAVTKPTEELLFNVATVPTILSCRINETTLSVVLSRPGVHVFQHTGRVGDDRVGDRHFCGVTRAKETTRCFYLLSCFIPKPNQRIGEPL